MTQIYRTPPIIPGESIPLLCRLKDTSGSYATQSTFSGIVLDIYDVDDPDNLVVPQVTLVVASTVYNTLQTDSRWTVDNTGYNFAYATLSTHTPRPDTQYRLKFTCTQTDGRQLKFVFEIPTFDPAKSS